MLPSVKKIPHPSWRVYRALQEIPEKLPTEYCLKDGIDVFFPYQELDDLTEALVRVIKADPEYDDSVFNITPCLALFSDTDARQILECALLKGYSVDAAAELTGLTHEFITIYKSVFYDLSVIPHGDQGKHSYVLGQTIGKDASVKKASLYRSLEFILADSGVSPNKISIDDMMMAMMVQAFKLARQKSESDERDDQMAAQSWANILKNYAGYFMNARKGKGGLTVEKLLLDLKMEPPPQGVDTLD